MHFIVAICELSAEIEGVLGAQSSTVHILLRSSKWGGKKCNAGFTYLLNVLYLLGNHFLLRHGFSTYPLTLFLLFKEVVLTLHHPYITLRYRGYWLTNTHWCFHLVVCCCVLWKSCLHCQTSSRMVPSLYIRIWGTISEVGLG